jgi:meiotic recombination protein SPO11
MTREFLQIVNKRAPNLPILALTDYDVDGLNIVRCYRYSMDPTSRSPATVNPGICWLGIKTAQVLKLAASMPALPGNNHSKSSDQLTISDDLALEGAIPPIECRDPIRHLTLRDRKVGMSVLAALLSHEGTDPTSAEMKIELQRMLMLGIKCEIQFLDESGSLVSWLDTSLLDHVSFLDDK